MIILRVTSIGRKNVLLTILDKFQGITVKEKEILVRAAEIGQDLGITNLTFSHGWLQRFKERRQKMEASNREIEHLKSVHVKQEHVRSLMRTTLFSKNTL